MKNKKVLKVNGREFEVYEGWLKYVGLMFKSPKPVAFVLKRKADIHTFFVFHEIDVFWVKGNEVVKKVRAKPFRVYPGVEADYILECPPGFLESEVGDRLSLTLTAKP
ncbi:MAG TPA: DUF192 domain-containing protein [Candidatus Aenigmarchaeota archaeon]|nr:DUF192 domain-containing protein [Candidatus Aenigmarchaeota archaeon]